jgi:hypothetical protein
MSLGDVLYAAGWRQGCLLKEEDQRNVLIGDPRLTRGARLFLISQSCDVIKTPDEAELTVELIIGRPLRVVEGNFTHNKNSRTLHITAKHLEGDRYYSMVQSDKITIKRSLLASIVPDPEAVLVMSEVRTLAMWLASRYQRAAFPNAFNQRIAAVKKSNRKLRAQANKLSASVSGLYLQLHPDKELEDGVEYSVNLLALVLAGSESDTTSAEIVEPIEAMVQILEASGMEVSFKIVKENGIAFSFVREYSAWSFDDISLRAEPVDPLPG